MYFVPHFGHAKVCETSIWTPCFQILAKTMHHITVIYTTVQRNEESVQGKKMAVEILRYFSTTDHNGWELPRGRAFSPDITFSI